MEDLQQEKLSHPEAILLAPLAIPKRNYEMAGVSRYRAYRADGTYELVEAHFAAEVPAKCSFEDIERIERETRHVMQAIPEEHVVASEVAEFIETNIEVSEEEAPAFITVDIAEATQSREELFEAFDLSQLHPQKENEKEQLAAAVEASEAVRSTDEGQVEAQLVADGDSEIEAASAEEPIEEVQAALEIPKERIEEPEAELSQDEIEALLND